MATRLLLQRLEDDLRCHVQAVKLMKPYCDGWAVAVQGVDARTLRLGRRRPSIGEARAIDTLRERLDVLAGRFFLPAGAVDPADVGDFGPYLPFADGYPDPFTTLAAAGLGTATPGREQFLQVTIDPQASPEQIQAQLRALGALGQRARPARDEWGGKWGLEQAFRALLLRALGRPAPTHETVMRTLGLQPADESARRQYYAMLTPAKRIAAAFAERIEQQQRLLDIALAGMPTGTPASEAWMQSISNEAWGAYAQFRRAVRRL